VKRRLSVVLALAMVFSLVLSSVTMAAEAVVGAQISNELQAEITVEEGETPEKSIQDLINAAAEGTVEVPAGIYEEDIIIEKSLTLKPAGDEQVTIQGHITVAASNVTVEGFTIKKTDAKPAITLKSGSKNVTISNNKIDGVDKGNGQPADAGIRITQDAEVTATIIKNEIANNTGNGIYVHTGGLASDGNFIVSENTVVKNRTGIVIDGKEGQQATVKIIDNTLKENTAHGISVGPATGYTLTIENNTFNNNSRSHFSDRRYSAEDATVSPSRKDILNKNTIEGLHAWAWNEEGGRWLLVPVQENMLKMSWVMGEGQTDGTLDDNGNLTVTVNENEEKNAAVKAEFVDNLESFTEEGTIKEIGKVLFVMEITDESENFVNEDVLTVIAADEQSLGCECDDANGFWYWGPREGFPFIEEATTEFTYSFKQAGEYSVKIYAVQLTE